MDNMDLRGKSLLITGGTGLIGKWMIEVLVNQFDCNIILLGRSEEKARKRFDETFWRNGHLIFVQWNPSQPSPLVGLNNSILEHTPVDYIVHLASNTHPVAYATDPVGTIVMNVNATKELLDFAVAKNVKRFVYASSVEIYGQNRGDCDRFREDYCGYIDSNTLRAGYPESKRCGEALCQAYHKQYGVDFVIPRIARVYGPTLQDDDTKALSQFMKNARDGRDVVLKSPGRQFFSYLHVADAVTGILTVLQRGVCGEAYNVADESSDIRLCDLAVLIAEFGGCKVVYDLPSETEREGFSLAMTARLNGDKLKNLGWSARYAIKEGVGMTMDSFRLKES